MRSRWTPARGSGQVDGGVDARAPALPGGGQEGDFAQHFARRVGVQVEQLDAAAPGATERDRLLAADPRQDRADMREPADEQDAAGRVGQQAGQVPGHGALAGLVLRRGGTGGRRGEAGLGVGLDTESLDGMGVGEGLADRCDRQGVAVGADEGEPGVERQARGFDEGIGRLHQEEKRSPAALLGGQSQHGEARQPPHRVGEGRLEHGGELHDDIGRRMLPEGAAHGDGELEAPVQDGHDPQPVRGVRCRCRRHPGAAVAGAGRGRAGR